MYSKKDIHSLDLEEIYKIYNTSKKGLSEVEAEKRLKLYGENTLKEKEESKFKIFIRQFNNILIYVLFLASLISVISYKYVDFFVIIVLIFINSIIGFVQEIKAISSIKALKKLTESKTKVIRDNKILELPSSKMVPGDVAIFSEGSIVTADVRLFDSKSLMIDESTITGESLPVIKDHKAKISKDALVYELKNTLLTGTIVVKGKASAIVTKTADNTYFASIAEEKEKSPKTPLTRAMSAFSARYVALLIILFLIVGIVGFLQHRSWLNLTYILIAELVSALPEGLPIVVTSVLVVGARKLSKKKTLVRYLPSVETLGSASIIATDKTGTITEGKLIVKEKFFLDEKMTKIIASLANDAKDNIGDPLDLALKNWIDNFDEIKNKYPQIKEYPFDVNLRMVASVNEIEGKKKLLIKGAYESLSKIAQNKNDFTSLEEELDSMSKKGLRIIALGYGDYNDKEFKDWKINIVGLVGFLDPPKEGVKEAVSQAKKAQIKVMMLTGDYPLTAKAIAKEVGIFEDNDSILTGHEIDQIDDKTLFEDLKNTTVLARILPEHKSRIVKVLQKNKHIVAVSGDGVNDIPALKAADLSIAMGSGTEAAKNVSKMIITDSNLKVIIDAVRNGRIITNNIRKVIYYLLSSGLQEITLITSAILLNLPLPLMPLQILWINIVTDGVQDKTFPFAKEEGDVMLKGPQKPIKKFFDLSQIIYILTFGFFAGLITLELFKHLLKNYSYAISLTITFTTVVVMQWANGIQAQKETEPFFKNIKKSFTINPYIFVGIGLGLILQLFAVYVFKEAFSTVKTPLKLWIYPFIMFLIAFFLVEIRKWIFLIFRRKK
ncbi:MAG: Calcium-transporting ATPase 1 [Candidatus Anoxychlamydiales bacterium]|nr:Calcium-transporting ATPase 1 [Candidatus Anoxychlamydiales bacterium]